jgi:hypothetical protein
VVAGRTLGVRGQAHHRLEQLVDERVPAEPAVGHHIEPGTLLHRDHLIDGAVLDLLVARRRHLSGLELRASTHEVVRTQQRSDDVGTNGHLLTLLFGLRGTAAP